MRFAFQRHPLDLASYPPTRNGRAPFVPLGVNSCPALVMAPGAPPAERFDWCYNSAADLNASAIDTGTKCEQQLPFCVLPKPQRSCWTDMATGYILSADGSQLSLYSGGTPESHGGGGDGAAGQEGTMNPHSGVKRHTIRTDGFVGLESGCEIVMLSRFVALSVSLIPKVSRLQTAGLTCRQRSGRRW